MSQQNVENKRNNLKGITILGLGALGVVYGDIGTSPLYALKEIFLVESQSQLHQNM